MIKRDLESERTNHCLGCWEEPQNCQCLKVHCDFPSPNPLCDAINNASVRRHLLAYRIVLGQFACPDVTFAYANHLIEPAANTIAFERYDQCDVIRKDLLDDERILSIIKTQKYFSECHPKVRIGPSYLHFTKLDRIARAAAEMTETKHVHDVSFVGSLYNPQTEVHHHRAALIAKLRKIKDLNVITSSNPWTFRHEAYYRHLAQTKIVVSPFGHGEPCYRDWEALLMGCEVIKPICDPILTEPPIYDYRVPSLFNWCKPDWSNLESVIYTVLESFDEERENRRKVQRLLLKIRSPAMVASLLDGLLRGICGSKVMQT